MKVLVIGDVHLPWPVWACVEACFDFSRKYKPDMIVQIGDFTDQKAWSRYPKDTDDMSPQMEWDQVELTAAKFHKFFPDMTILSGNHCRRAMQKALEVGLPKQLIRSLADVFPYKDWHWHLGPQPLVLDDVCYIHGDETLGNAWQKAQRLGQSIVQGHDHLGYLQFIHTFQKKYFGMSVGCMLDSDSIAARYAARNLARSFLGWATVTDGEPQLYRWQHGKKKS